MVSVDRYGKRFWAVYEAGDLLCVTVYKRGAQAVKARLERAVAAQSDSPVVSFLDPTDGSENAGSNRNVLVRLPRSHADN